MATIYNSNEQQMQGSHSQSELRWLQPLFIGLIGISLFLLLAPREHVRPPVDQPGNTAARRAPEGTTPSRGVQRTPPLGLADPHVAVGRPLPDLGLGDSWMARGHEESPAQPVELPQRSRELDDLVAKAKTIQSLTPEGVKDMRLLLRELRKQGVDAVPAIRDFLRSREDVNFANMDGGALAEHHTLRQALFDILRQIGGDEAIAVSLEQLSGNQDPAEIAMLARNLEEAAPGVYRDEAVRVASTALQLLADAKQIDTRPLFEVLRDLGGADAATVLAQFPANADAVQYLRNKNTNLSPTVRTYALMSLASMPSGEGVPTLAALAGDADVPVEHRSPEPFRMLAQASVDYTKAGKALVDLARAGQIPERAWGAMADALAGKHLQFPSQLSGGLLPGQNEADVSGAESPFVRGFYDDEHHIKYEERTVAADWSPKQIKQQLALIDTLLNITANPVGVNALQQARASLQRLRPMETQQ
jgi:hypothetical protein